MGLGQANAFVLRANMEAFIEYRPESVTLTRSSRVSDGMGGFVDNAPATLPPQEMRLIPAKSVTEQAPIRVTTEGQQVSPNWYLVIEEAGDIAIGDTAIVRGHKLEVIFVSDLPEGRIVAECWESF